MSGIAPLDQATRELYVCYDYGYFFRRAMSMNGSLHDNSQIVEDHYNRTMAELRQMIRANKKQALYHVDGVVRRMHATGTLPKRLELHEDRRIAIFSFAEEGREWAYFDVWKKYEKRKIFLIKSGAMYSKQARSWAFCFQS